MNKHKHKWVPSRFVGDPGQWDAKMVRICSVSGCTEETERTAMSTEHAAEALRRLCPRCKQPHALATPTVEGCLLALNAKIDRLERLIMAGGSISFGGQS
jgi:hypothetical protein